MLKLATISTILSSVLAFAQVNPVDIKSITIENPRYNIEQAAPATVEVKPTIQRVPVEGVVKEYFKDIPILIKVAQCESEFRQFDSAGVILRGRENPFDVGVMQINEKYHLERSEQIGINIYDLMGNMQYARALYKEQGTAPWVSSYPCWSKL